MPTPAPASRCVDDSPECISRRQTTLRHLVDDQGRAWVKEPATPEAYASGVRLFAFKTKKKELTCDELAHGRREAEAARATLKNAGSTLTAAQVTRGTHARERGRRSCRPRWAPLQEGLNPSRRTRTSLNMPGKGTMRLPPGRSVATIHHERHAHGSSGNRRHGRLVRTRARKPGPHPSPSSSPSARASASCRCCGREPPSWPASRHFSRQAASRIHPDAGHPRRSGSAARSATPRPIGSVSTSRTASTRSGPSARARI